MAKVGRPLKFETPEIMEGLINKYFEDCDKNNIPYTTTGLAMALDTDRLTLINYSGKQEFINTIKRAKTKIENAYELRLIDKGRSGDIFALKNFDWTDRQEVDNTVHIDKTATDELFESIENLKNEDK